MLVIVLAIAGFNGILGSGGNVAEDLGLSVGTSKNKYGRDIDGVQTLDKAALSKIIRKAVIGSFILFGSSTIVKIVFKMISGI